MSTPTSKRKKLSYKFKDYTLRNIVPLTDAQKKVFEKWKTSEHLLLIGPAGTGKSFLAVYLMLKDLFTTQFGYNKIFIIRSTVPTRDQGFLPGTLEEKMVPYEIPYKAIVDHILSTKGAYEALKELGSLEFMSTSYIRGLTLDNCLIFVDEMQNFNFGELDSVITRMGNNSRIIFSGDFQQTELIIQKDGSGFKPFIKILQSLSEFSSLEFNVEDIVRSGLCKNYLVTKLKLGL